MVLLLNITGMRGARVCRENGILQYPPHELKLIMSGMHSFKPARKAYLLYCACSYEILGKNSCSCSWV